MCFGGTQQGPTTQNFGQQASNSIAATTYDPADLVRYTVPGFAMYFDASASEHIAERIQASLARPFYIQGWRLVTSSSIGIALTGPGYRRADELVRDADLAMYQAKSKGMAGFAVFDNHLDPIQFPKVGLEVDIRQAVST